MLNWLVFLSYNKSVSRLQRGCSACRTGGTYNSLPEAFHRGGVFCVSELYQSGRAKIQGAGLKSAQAAGWGLCESHAYRCSLTRPLEVPRRMYGRGSKQSASNLGVSLDDRAVRGEVW
jgi:hypothetical protein